MKYRNKIKQKEMNLKTKHKIDGLYIIGKDYAHPFTDPFNSEMDQGG